MPRVLAVTLVLGMAIDAAFFFVTPFTRDVGLARSGPFFVSYATVSILIRLLGRRALDVLGPHRVSYPAFAIFGLGFVLTGFAVQEIGFRMWRDDTKLAVVVLNLPTAGLALTVLLVLSLPTTFWRAAMVAFVGSDNVTWNISSDSTVVSPRTGTGNDCVVTPGAKVRVVGPVAV